MKTVVFRTDRSEPNWDECVMKVENRFLRLSRDLPVRYRRSWACFDGDDEGYPTKKDRRNRITGSRNNFSDHRIGPPKIVIRSDPFRTLHDTMIIIKVVFYFICVI